MKLFLKKTSIAIAILFCSMLIVNITGLILTKTDNYFKIDNSINKLILGDSHTECAIDDRLLKGSINLSSSADSYFYSYVKLRKFITENPQIDTVFLSYTYSSFYISKDTAWLLNAKHMASKFQRYFSIYEKEDIVYLLKANSLAFIQANFFLVKGTMISIVRTFYKKKSFENLTLGGYKKLKRNKLELDILRISKNINTTLFVYSEKQVDFLFRISKFCVNRNIELILINTPIHKVLNDTYNEEKKFYFQLYKNKLKKHTLIDYADYYIPDFAYADCGHLNFKGASIFSKQLNRLLLNTVSE